MQVLCTVESIATYKAACNPFDLVSRPEDCRGCGGQGCFHRNGTYERYAGRELIRVARFRCKHCGGSVSVLPDFLLPYRNLPLVEVDAYFRATAEQRRGQSGADLLRRYWRRWVGHCGRLQRCRGSDPGGLDRDPLGFWRQLGGSVGALAREHGRLIDRYGLSLLGRYRCHAVA